MAKWIMHITFMLLLVATVAKSQQQVSGKVVSETGVVKGANLSIGGVYVAHGSAEGLFSFTVPKLPFRLNISCIGYNTIDTLINSLPKSSLYFYMELAVAELKEVKVNTGYQQLSVEKLAGSFDVIGKQKLNEQISTGVLERLEGVASSVSVDRKTTKPGIAVRGISTLNGERGALIILDNFPYEGDLNNINPNTVESITILKDAAAGSIWGAKAANGVIVITTRKGRYNQGLKINYNANTSIIARPKLDYFKPMSSSGFIDMETFLFGKDYYKSLEQVSSSVPLTPVVELLIAKRDGKIAAATADAQLAYLRTQNGMKQYEQQFYQTGINRQYALDLSGGHENEWWTFIMGYDQNKDNLNALYQRLNVQLKQHIRPLKNMDVELGAHFTKSIGHSGKQEYKQITTTNGAMPPYVNFVDEAGTALPVMKDYRGAYLRSFAGFNQLLDWNYYPAREAGLMPKSTKLQDIMANVNLSYKLGGITMQVLYQYGTQNVVGEQFYEGDSYYTRNLVNTLTQVSGGTVQRPIPVGTIYDYSNVMYNRHHLRGQLDYKKTFSTQHELNIFGGAEMRNEHSDADGFRNYGYNKELGNYVAVDFVNNYPRFFGSGVSPIANNGGYSFANERYVSLFANAGYTYLNKYTLTASTRRDASNLFGLNTNDKWNPFWSVGASWQISKEQFFNKLMDYLRLRASYGVSGNVSPAMAAVTTIAYDANSIYTQQPQSNFKNYINPELRWEQSFMFNVGLDFAVAGNKVRGSVEYYRKRGNDLFGAAVIDATAGVGNTITKNVAAMVGSGVDVSLQLNHKIGKINWQGDLNFSFNTNQVTDYYLVSNSATLLLQGTNRIAGVIGKPAYALYSYKWGGLDGNGNPIGYVNGAQSSDYAYMTANARTANDVVYHGSIMPTYFGAIGSTVSYGNVSLSFRFNTKLGYYFRRSTISYTNLVGGRVGHSDYALRWQKAGDEAHTNVPAFVYPIGAARNTYYEFSEVTAEHGDHVRLQYINLSYAAFKQSRFNTLKNLQVFAAGNNLGIVWAANKQGLDPDYLSLPPSRIWSFGIKGSL